MGKTHFKIGILYYVLIGLLPLHVFLTVFDYEISLIGAIAAAFGALLPDADCENSNINRMNPLLGTSYKVIEKIEKKVVLITRYSLTIVTGALILWYSRQIIAYIRLIPLLSTYAQHITYALIIFVIIVGLSNNKAIKYIPVIGWIYTCISSGIYRTGRKVKRMIMLLLYGGTGAALAIYNYLYLKDNVIFIVSGLFILMVLFPHRTFMHSVEGIFLLTAAFWYIARHLGYDYLAVAFFIGYFSHLYLGDLFTGRGVPLSVVPLVFRKLRVHNYLRKNMLYRCIYNVFNIRLRVPIMMTGTGWGNLLETIYIVCISAGIIVLVRGTLTNS
jgi:hypothetical protein